MTVEIDAHSSRRSVERVINPVCCRRVESRSGTTIRRLVFVSHLGPRSCFVSDKNGTIKRIDAEFTLSRNARTYLLEDGRDDFFKS